jgi:hypothetical protein
LQEKLLQEKLLQEKLLQEKLLQAARACVRRPPVNSVCVLFV